jgi:hypothetical protein
VADISVQLRLQAVLAEYQALRAETLQKLGHHLQLYAVSVTGVSAVIGWAVSTQKYDVLLIVPIPAAAFALRYVWEQTVIIMIGDYLRLMEREMFPALVGKRTEPQCEHERLWIGWQHYFHDHFPRFAFYKPAVLILMVVIPFAPAMWHSAASLYASRSGTHIAWATSLPMAVHATALVVYAVAAAYLSRRLWAT